VTPTTAALSTGIFVAATNSTNRTCKACCVNHYSVYLRYAVLSANFPNVNEPLCGLCPPYLDVYGIGNCKFWLKRKILFIFEMKLNEILLKPKVKDQKTFAKYCQLSFKFWMKIDHLLSIFHGMNET
jgi:hypothetical protein